MRFIQTGELIALYMTGARQLCVSRANLDDFYSFISQKFSETPGLNPVILYSSFYLKKTNDAHPEIFHVSESDVKCTCDNAFNTLRQIVGQMPKRFGPAAVDFTLEYMKKNSIGRPEKKPQPQTDPLEKFFEHMAVEK